MSNGRFLVLECVDGAGTTTHTKILVDALKADGIPLKSTREPSDGPIGVMLRQILTGRLVVPTMQGPRAPTWGTMALLFAADRLDHIDAEITPNLMEGVTVLSDRYDYSSVAYQSLTSDAGGASIEWVQELNRHARRPDLTIVLDVPPEVAKRRRGARHGAPDLYDDDALQVRLCTFYKTIEKYYPKDKIVHVNADRDQAVVAAEILKHVRDLGVGRGP